MTKTITCPLCNKVNDEFIIYPAKDNKLIKWECGHILYKNGFLYKIEEAEGKNDCI